MRVSTHNITPPPTYNPTRTPSTSKDLTVPSNVSLLRPIHQRQTEAYWKLEDYTPDDKDEDIANVITIQASNQHSNATLSPFLRQMLEHPGRTIHHSFFTSPVANTVRGGGGQKCYGFWRGHFDPVPSLPTLLHLIFLDWLFRTDFVIFGGNVFLPVTGIGLRRSCRLHMMHTCLSSFFSSENILNSNHNFLIESISIIYVLSFPHRES